MRRLERYVTVGDRRLRCGYTTGTCAAGAARAAAEFLLAGEPPAALAVETPAGVRVLLEVESSERGADWASCAVRKDGGDDPDATDGLFVFSRVALRAEAGVSIAGGEGVGRVTRPGLDQPVGQVAINSVPRQMIAAQLAECAGSHGYQGGFEVEVSVPGGEGAAARTFNPRLGVVGGISILGTSGIVRPMSEDALVDSLELEMRQLRAAGVTDLLVVPGNYGRDFAREGLGLDVSRCVQCSNYLGRTLDAAVQLRFRSVLVVGHVGKLVKVAAGVMNTHSRVADARFETLAAHAALCGADRALATELMGCATTDAALDLLAATSLLEDVMGSVEDALGRRLSDRVRGVCDAQAVMFSKSRGLLGATRGADALVALHKGGERA